MGAEKSEISHTNAIILLQEHNQEKIVTAAKDETSVWSHTLAELARPDWSAYPVHLTEPRSPLVGKTGIGALERRRHIAWHRCTILAMTEVW